MVLAHATLFTREMATGSLVVTMSPYIVHIHICPFASHSDNIKRKSTHVLLCTLHLPFNHSLSQMPGLTIDLSRTPTWLPSINQKRNKYLKTMESAKYAQDATEVWKSSRPSPSGKLNPVIIDVYALRTDKIKMTASPGSTPPYDGALKNENTDDEFEEDHDEDFGDFQAADPFSGPVYYLPDTYGEDDMNASLLSHSDLIFSDAEYDDGSNPTLRKPLRSHLEAAISNVLRGKEDAALNVPGVSKPNQKQGERSWSSWRSVFSGKGNEARSAMKAWGDYWREKNNRSGDTDTDQPSAVVDDERRGPTVHFPKAEVDASKAMDDHIDPVIDGFVERELARWRE
jgi:hypothetical protein